MTNDDIRAGFEELFGSQEPEPEPEPEPDVQEPEPTGQEPEGTEPNGQEPEPEPSGDEPDGTAEDKQKARQNYQFAKLRTENKKQGELIKSLGRAIGMDKGSTPEEIATKVQELILQKESKETNIPVEMLQRMQELESIVAENSRIKIENETQKAFTSLAEKYNLSSDELTSFATYLGENGKNPLEGAEVDIETEYIKLHYNDLVKAAVTAALEEEAKRQENVNNHAGAGVPGNASEQGDGGSKIETIADLEKYFQGMKV